MYIVAMVAEFKLRQGLNKQDLLISKFGLLLLLNVKLTKSKSWLLYGTILQWGSLTLVTDWVHWTLSTGCVPSWKRPRFVLSSIDIYSVMHSHVPMAVILPALLHQDLLNALFIVMMFCALSQTKNRCHCKRGYQCANACGIHCPNNTFQTLVISVTVGVNGCEKTP